MGKLLKNKGLGGVGEIDLEVEREGGGENANC